MRRWVIPVGVAFAGTTGTVFLFAVVKDASLARTYALAGVVVLAFAVYQALRARR